ncbi:hypothetical protein IGI04_016347 [Brassica rapa subsp. trilocularis]|uniref:Uncharacterized protein n=1 Tax=Brassica rapa subsp. trilocularis TaxID=1813537 RepID=A0ABQ7MV65_BRACM|nr:hypothetical protein IGI04_016347 [Brassica rapa subsp. trilocularis]
MYLFERRPPLLLSGDVSPWLGPLSGIGGSLSTAWPVFGSGVPSFSLVGHRLSASSSSHFSPAKTVAFSPDLCGLSSSLLWLAYVSAELRRIFMALMEGSSFDFSRFDVLRILVLHRFGFDILLVVLLKSFNGLFFFDDLFPLCPVDRREVVPVTIFSVKTVTDLNTRVPPLLSVFTRVPHTPIG